MLTDLIEFLMKWYSICSFSVALDATLIFVFSSVKYFASTNGYFCDLGIFFSSSIEFVLFCLYLTSNLNSRNESCVMLQGEVDIERAEGMQHSGSSR